MTWTIQPRSKFGPLSGIAAGEGPLVLLIHGVGLRAEAWGAQFDALAQTARVVAIDLPGHGDSPCLVHAAKLSDYVDAVAATLDAPAIVIGHSLGAMIALDLAIKRPDLVPGVVALNAIYQREPDAQKSVLARASSLDGQTVADPTATLQRWFGDIDTAERAACGDWLRDVDPAGYRDAYRVFAAENGPNPHDLQALKCPALFVTGADEPNSTPAMSRAMANLAPRGQVEVLTGAAHMMPMTHASKINALLRAFQTVVSQTRSSTGGA